MTEKQQATIDSNTIKIIEIEHQKRVIEMIGKFVEFIDDILGKHWEVTDCNKKEINKGNPRKGDRGIIILTSGDSLTIKKIVGDSKRYEEDNCSCVISMYKKHPITITLKKAELSVYCKFL